MSGRWIRRMAGLLQARLPELDLEGVPDPRAREDRWSLAQILRATLVGLMAGCRSLREAERLTEVLPRAARRLLGLPRRLADTTARDALCRVPLDGLRAVLHRAVRAAWRRKALAPKELPVGVVALDGKVTAVPMLNQPYVQSCFDKPWIEANANGMLAVLLLRRIAYTLLALYRAVTLRSDEGRATEWKDLLARVRDALVALSPDHILDLRTRETAPATR
jgi:hypothetical protein